MTLRYRLERDLTQEQMDAMSADGWILLSAGYEPGHEVKWNGGGGGSYGGESGGGMHIVRSHPEWVDGYWVTIWQRTVDGPGG